MAGLNLISVPELNVNSIVNWIPIGLNDIEINC